MKCDLHVHTFYSRDSNSSPKEMVETAIKKGIDCLAITDHDEIRGALQSIEYAKGKSILIIPGIEIKTKKGDILALNVKKIISNKLSVSETIKKIKEAGGIAILPHPFSCFTPFKGNLKEIVSEIDGIEVQNASSFGLGKKKALDFARKFNLLFTSGSDAHFPNFIGRVYLKIAGENLSIEEVLKKIKEKNVKLGGREANFFEKIIDHLKRNIVKIFHYFKRINNSQ